MLLDVKIFKSLCVFYQHVEELQKSQAEIQRLHAEREHYEDSMKKAFMRGVCALNIEALSMFNTGEVGRFDRGEKIIYSLKIICIQSRHVYGNYEQQMLCIAHCFSLK